MITEPIEALQFLSLVVKDFLATQPSSVQIAIAEKSQASVDAILAALQPKETSPPESQE